MELQTLPEPVFIGVDFSTAPDFTTTSYIFICGDCERQENRPLNIMPAGWDALELDCSGTPFLRCPDCMEAIEQRHFAAIASGPDRVRPTAEDFISPPKSSAFQLFLERQNDGSYQIAMHPEAVLMRWLPHCFYLDPASARATAAELIRYADLAEHPGTLPASMGAVA
ncbi:hypothetical protein C1T17_16310 [Sphingobium sp. SCG-1]|uniref:hypothetical protein n=1 Tax=Sphingobium sp. SCG-1 TaxID=2072936 RepID=UPI000CD6A464|nr:hypothetical protein [Sphingobium sp. SCG-1]AUW59416.1 hypothetical protein C1T17_16310 [Sphingobium sp. SCG-1]